VFGDLQRVVDQEERERESAVVIALVITSKSLGSRYGNLCSKQSALVRACLQVLTDCRKQSAVVSSDFGECACLCSVICNESSARKNESVNLSDRVREREGVQGR